MSTIFYQHRFERPFPITFLLLERLDLLIQANGGELDDRLLLEALASTGGPRNPTEEELEYLVDRLLSRGAPNKPRAKPKQRSFGAALYEHRDGMDLIEQMISAWGLAEARRMYLEEDRDDVLEALAIVRRDEAAHQAMLWEAFLYASGGRYNDDNSGSELKVIDFTEDPDAAFAELERAIKAANSSFH